MKVHPSLFHPHQWIEDTRDPVFEFTIHDQSYGVYLFSITMWVGLLTLIALFAALASVASLAIYHTAVRQPNTMTAYLMGLGLYLPFFVFAPQEIAQACFGMQNKICFFCFCGVAPTACIFRTMEAMFGFTPEYARESAASFALYFSSPLYLVHDHKSHKYIKASSNGILKHLLRFQGFLLLTGLFQSLFSLSSFFPSLGAPITPTDWYDWNLLWDLQMWTNTICYAMLLQLYLTTFGEGFMFVTALVTQRQAEALMDNPLLKSKSPSEFWGKRWNTLIHKCLKNGVYKPVRMLGGTKEIAVWGSFLASGLFHEWIVTVVIHSGKDNIRTTPIGTTLAFFAWQAALISVEYSVGNSKTVTYLVHRIPMPLRTALVILSGVPLGHWFLEPYIHSNFFLHGQLTMFSILPIQQQYL